MARTSSYTDEELRDAVQLVLGGNTAAATARLTGIPVSTIRKWVYKAREGVWGRQRRGPPTRMPGHAERDLCDWIVGRQLICRPATRAEVMSKAKAMLAMVPGGGIVTDGWYTRFMQRHSDLVLRNTQTLSKGRNSVVGDDCRVLFHTMAKVVIEKKLTRHQVFNMDETAFQKTPKSKTVIAVRGSKNVWSAEPVVSFHMTIVACGSAAGWVVPPVFVTQGKTVRLDVLQHCGIDGAAVTATPSGFVNMELFEKWLLFFESSVPSDIPRPLLLVMDGCSSHYSPSILETAERLNILLVCLPANSSRLFQPLDVAVLAAFKLKLRNLINELTDEDENGVYSIDKQTAIRLACMAWKRCRFGRNITAGFRACGLFPVSLVNMQDRYNRYKTNGTEKGARMAAWLEVKTAIRENVLTLPAPPLKPAKRKTTPVSGRLLTSAMLADISADLDRKKNSKKHKAVNEQVTDMVV